MHMMDRLSIIKSIMLVFLCVTCIACAQLSYRCSGSCTDNEITTNVQVKIASDRCLANQNIEVYTFEHIVTLEGSVENPSQRVIAVGMARSVPRVSHVVDKLTIKNRYNI
jgi:osmotically-inducible protein OsmY